MSAPDPTPGYYPQQPHYVGWGPPAAPTGPVRTPPHRRPGVWFAVLAAALVLVLVSAGATLAVRWLRGAAVLGEVGDPTTVHSRRLDPGHCVQELPTDGNVGDVVVVPCDQPHDAEVLGLRDLRDVSWTDPEDLVTAVARSCEMDLTQREAGWRAVIWAPSAESWGQGDRTGTCLAWLEAGKAVGSWTDGDTVTPAG